MAANIGSKANEALRVEGTKWCPRCEEAHPLAAFSRDKGASDGLNGWCRASRKRVGKARGYTRKAGNVPQAVVDRMLAEQGGRCAMPDCQTCDPGSLGWCLDHNHTTGALRGILCGRCNVRLGFYEKDVARHGAFETYLGRMC